MVSIWHKSIACCGIGVNGGGCPDACNAIVGSSEQGRRVATALTHGGGQAKSGGSAATNTYRDGSGCRTTARTRHRHNIDARHSGGGIG